jgi:hypothetical protein
VLESYDLIAQGYDSVLFWAKKESDTDATKLDILIADYASTPEEEGGGCADPCAYDHPRASVNLTTEWQEYTIALSKFARLSTPTPVDFTQAFHFHVAQESSTVEFWVDDLRVADLLEVALLGGGSSLTAEEGIAGEYRGEYRAQGSVCRVHFLVQIPNPIILVIQDATERIGHELLCDALGETRVFRKNLTEFDPAAESGAVRHRARGIHRLRSVKLAEGAHCVIVLQTKSQRIHDRVTRTAGRIGTM